VDYDRIYSLTKMLSEQSMDILSSSKTTTGGEGKGNGKQKTGNGK